MATTYEKTEDRIKRNLQPQNGMLDGDDPDYAKLPDVEYGDTVAIDWTGDLEGVTDYGYVFCWPDNEEDDANMGGVVPYSVSAESRRQGSRRRRVDDAV